MATPSSRIAHAAKMKGYTQKELLNIVNAKLAMNLQDSAFMRAINDHKIRSVRDEWICEQTEKIIKELPDLAAGSQNFATRAHALGISVVDVYKYYAATRENPRPYNSFYKSVRDRRSPWEIAVAKEADKCLEEIAAQRKEGQDG